MTVIFSDRAVDGCEGLYCNPKFFEGFPPNTTSVITKHDHIKKAAKEQGLVVRDFPKQPPTGKVEKETPPPAPKSGAKITEPKEAVITEDEPPLIAGLTDVVTTFEEDIRAGMDAKDIMGKHGVSRQKITAAKKKLLK